MSASETSSRHTDIAIIGSGFGGLGAAIRLKREGIDDFVVLERAGDVGGTPRCSSCRNCRSRSRGSICFSGRRRG